MLRSIGRQTTLIILCCCHVLLSGCSPDDFRDTVRNKVSNLFVLQTVTMPALSTVKPSNTPTITQTPIHTSTPVIKPSATSTIISVRTPTEYFVDISQYPESAADFLEVVEDVTIPDGTIFSPNQMFVKSWRLQNSGSLVWNDDYRLVVAYSNPFGSPQASDATFIQPTDLIDFSISSWGPRLYNVRKGGTADLAVPLQAPADPGEYMAEFFLINSDNEVVTPRFWIQFKVALKPEQVSASETAVSRSSQTPDLTRTPAFTATPASVPYDWTGKWLFRDPFSDSDMNTAWGWLTQTGNEVKGFFYDTENEPVLIEGYIDDEGRTLEGKFAWPWQNRAAPFVWKMLANKDQFYSVSEDGKVAFGSMCGGRNGSSFPDYCAMPAGD
jgi:hypothetical protein